jgi:hypothetical protein
MKIKMMSTYVDDQEKALRGYTDKLGFVPADMFKRFAKVRSLNG